MIREARPDELEAMTELAMRSKAHWGYDDAFMDACRPVLTFTSDDLGPMLAVSEEDGTLTGLASISLGGKDAHLEKLFIAPEAMGQGLGRLLFGWAEALARQKGGTRLMIEADPDARPFYERMGAHVIGTAPSEAIPGRELPLLEKAL